MPRGRLDPPAEMANAKPPDQKGVGTYKFEDDGWWWYYHPNPRPGHVRVRCRVKQCEACGEWFVANPYNHRRIATCGRACGAEVGWKRRGAKRRILKDGYVFVLAKDHPPLAGRNGRYVPEHRVVMQAALGRPLREDEQVHHINGDRTDNRPENLQLRQRGHGNGIVMCCGECGSRNLVPVQLD